MCRALPQRPSGGPSAGPLSTDLLLQQLSRAASLDEVLRVDERHGRTAAAGFYHVELVAALARCLPDAMSAEAGAGSKSQGGGGGKDNRARTAAEVERVRALVPSLLKELTARADNLSFKQLASVLVSLGSLLPALRMPPPPNMALVAALPAAAGNAAAALPRPAATPTTTAAASTPPAQPPSLPLTALEEAFVAADQLYWRPGQGSVLPPQLLERLREYLRSVVVAGPGAAAALSAGAGTDMAALAAGVALAARFGLPQPPEWVAAVAGRVDALIAAALPPEPASNGNRGEAARSFAQQGQCSDVPASAGRGKKPKGGAAATQAPSDSSLADGRDGGTNPSAAASRKRSSKHDDAEASRAPRELDVRSLAQLLASWCSVPPPPPTTLSPRPAAQPPVPLQPGSDAAPLDWAGWVTSTAEVVWLALDPRTQERREGLAAEAAALTEQLEEARRQQARLKRAAQVPQQTEMGGGGVAVAGSGGGGAGSRRAGALPGGKARGSATGVPVPAQSPSPSTPTPGLAQEGDVPSDPAAAAAAVTRLESDLQQVAQQLRALGPVPSPALASSVDAALVVQFAVALGGALGGRCSSSGGGRGGTEGVRCAALAEAVLRSRMNEIASQPGLPIGALVALSRMRHPPSPQLLSAALTALQHRLRDLQPQAALALLTALESFGEMGKQPQSGQQPCVPPRSPSPREVLEPLAAAVTAAGTAAPPDLLLTLVRLCGAWGVPLPANGLAAVARGLERRLRIEVNEITSPQLWQTLSSSKRYMVDTASLPMPQSAAPLPQGSGASGGASFLSSMLEGALLPLSRLGQHFEGYEVFMAALHNWREAGFSGLTAAKATALLRTVAAAKGWFHPPMMRQDLELLLVSVLREEWLLEAGVGAEELAALLLAAAGALRVMAGKVQRSGGGIAEDAAPLAAPLLLPAVEWLLALRPNAEQLAAAAQALFVELEWDGSGPSSRGSSRIDSGPKEQQRQRQLLSRMLELAEPSLLTAEVERAGTVGLSDRSAVSAQGCAYMLAACARCGYVPPPRLLIGVYTAALRALQQPTGTGASAAVLVSLVRSISGLGAAAGEANETDAPNTTADTAALAAAREQLLRAVAVSLTVDDSVLSVFSSQPVDLVDAVRQVALLGVKLPAAWLASYASLVQGLMPRLEAPGLAYAASGLALLGGSPPASWVDGLLTQAEQRVTNAAGINWQQFDTYNLGLLLGAVHTLWGGISATSGGGSDGNRPLSNVAQQAWSRAHNTFVGGGPTTLPRYSPAELHTVVAAVAAFELRRPFIGASSSGGGKDKAGSGSGGKATLRATDFMGRVEAKWLEACAAALVEARRRHMLLSSPRGDKSAVSASPASSSADLPTAGLLLDLLRLTSRVVVGSADGDLRALGVWCRAAGAAQHDTGTAADQAQDLLEYVQLSLADWAAVGRPGASGKAATLAAAQPQQQLSLADWSDLLCGAMDADIEPPVPALEAYCGRLFPYLADQAGKMQQAPAPAASGGQEAQQRQRALWAAVESALSRVLLRVLPWVPPPALAAPLAEGFLLRAPLEQASVRQLGLLCTYCTQAGLGGVDAWARIRAELLRRLPLTHAQLLSQQQEPMQQHSPQEPKLTAAAAAVSSRADRVQAQRGGEIGEAEAVAVADVAAICYALEMAGCSAGPAPVRWLQQRGADQQATTAATAAAAGMEAARDAAMVMPKQKQQQGKQKQQLLQADQQQIAIVAWHSESLAFAALASLQQLWVTRGCRDGDNRQAQTLSAAFSSNVALDSLLPCQLTQLLTLASEGACQLPPSIAAALLERMAELDCIRTLEPVLASAVLVRALPITARQSTTAALAEVAVVALPVLPSPDIIPLLVALERWPGWRPSQQELEAVVGQLLDAVEVEDIRSLEQSLQAMRVLVVAASESQPDVALDTMLPLLQRAFPAAEERLWEQALPERLAVSVRGAAAAAASNVLQGLLEETAGLEVMYESARAAADTMVLALAALLQDAEDKQAALVRGSGKSSNSVDDTSGRVAWDRGGVVAVPAAQRAVPAEAAGALVAALVAAGGKQALPRPVAAIVLWLLGYHGVLRGVPSACLEHALQHSLVGHDGLPVCDATAIALKARVQFAGRSHAIFESDNIRGLQIARQLRQCGASALLSHRALASMTPGEMAGMPRDGVATVLQEMNESGVKEWGISNITPSWNTGDACTMQTVFRHVAAAAINDTKLKSAAGLHSTLHALHHAAHVGSRISACMVWALGFKGNVMWTGDNRLLPAQPSADHLQLVWRLLDLHCTLGPVSLTDVWNHTLLNAGFLRRARQEEEEEVVVQYCYWIAHARLGFRNAKRSSPYMLDGNQAVSILRGLWHQVEEHTAAAAAPMIGGSTTTTSATTGNLLTSRQLGLLYGLAALRSKYSGEACSGREEELQSYGTKLWPLYLASLDALVTRTDLPPLDYLNAMLDALEPAVMQPASDMDFALSADYLTEVLPPLISRFVDVVMQVMAVNEPEQPAGVSHLDDILLVSAPRHLEPRCLLDDLYWPPGEPGRLQLPEELRPPAGTRHGFGDPAGDAARERYVREVAPWYLAARRCFRLAMTTMEAPPSCQLGELLEAHHEYPELGDGRWAQLFGAVLTMSEDARKQNKLVNDEFAKAVKGWSAADAIHQSPA